MGRTWITAKFNQLKFWDDNDFSEYELSEEDIAELEDYHNNDDIDMVCYDPELYVPRED